MCSVEAIPPIPDVTGWRNILIEENGEPLVSLEGLSQRIEVRPFYYEAGVPGSVNGAFARSSVAERLAQAAEGLPAGYRFAVFDAWRPMQVQRYLYEAFYSRLQQEYPHLGNDELAELTSKYVSRPAADPLHPSPHFTGASIDLSLLDAGGSLVDMGTGFDDFTKRSRTRYYEELEQLAGRLGNEDLIVRDHRRQLFHVMAAAGFTNYSEEWWHFDYGNQFWAKVTGQPTALYSQCPRFPFYK